jgi:23S rRNA pseudouridine955/2504/2580 synthase
MKEITITTLEEGQRLDRVLQKYLSKATPGFLYKMLRKKNITLNGHKADGKEKLGQGDVIRIYFAEETLEKFTSEDRLSPGAWPVTSLEIVYEDEQILLVNKPAGMLSQKSEPDDVSLNEYAIGYLLASGAIRTENLSSFRPSVCNRLDRNTSGIVAVGKTTAALQELSRMFRERSIHKYYQALVLGNVEEARTIEAMLVKDESANQVKVYPCPAGVPSGEAMMPGETVLPGETMMPGETVPSGETMMSGGTVPPGEAVLSGGTIPSAGAGHLIRTRYVPAGHRTDGDMQHALTLLEIELITGRTHQIRAHLASTGHPIVGDPKYGSRRRNEYFAREYGLRRQLLHAGRIAFTKEDGALGYLCGREFTAKLPEDFRRILKAENIGSSRA